MFPPGKLDFQMENHIDFGDRRTRSGCPEMHNSFKLSLPRLKCRSMSVVKDLYSPLYNKSKVFSMLFSFLTIPIQTYSWTSNILSWNLQFPDSEWDFLCVLFWTDTKLQAEIWLFWALFFHTYSVLHRSDSPSWRHCVDHTSVIHQEHWGNFLKPPRISWPSPLPTSWLEIMQSSSQAGGLGPLKFAFETSTDRFSVSLDCCFNNEAYFTLTSITSQWVRNTSPAFVPFI